MFIHNVTHVCGQHSNPNLELELGWHTVQGVFLIPACWIFNAAALMSSKPRYSAGGLDAGLYSLLLLIEGFGGAISGISGTSTTLILKCLTSPFKYSSAPKSLRRSGQIRVGRWVRTPLLLMLSFWHRPSCDEHVFIFLLKGWSSLLQKDKDFYLGKKWLFIRRINNTIKTLQGLHIRLFPLFTSIMFN